MIRETKRKIGGYYAHTTDLDVVLGENQAGERVVLIQGGQYREAKGVSFSKREQVEALAHDLEEVLARWDTP